MNNLAKTAIAALVAAMMLPTSIAFAQGPDNGPPSGGFGGGPQGGFGGGFGGGPQGGFGGGQPGGPFGGPQGGFQRGGFMGGPQGGPNGEKVSAVTTQLATLTTVLNLTSSEQTQIESIQQEYRTKMAEITPRPDDNGAPGQGDGRPPLLDAASRAKIDDVAAKMSDQITALLTSDQQASLTTLITRMKELQRAQISPRLYSRLALTSNQYDQIAKIEDAAKDVIRQAVAKAATSEDYDELDMALQDSHRTVQTKVETVLTQSQEAMVQNGRQGMGGMGGPGFGGQRQGFAAQGFGGPGAGRSGGQGFGGPGGGFGGPGGGPGGQGFGGPGGPPQAEENPLGNGGDAGSF